MKSEIEKNKSEVGSRIVSLLGFVIIGYSLRREITDALSPPKPNLQSGRSQIIEGLGRKTVSGCRIKFKMADELSDFEDRTFEREIECKNGTLRIQQAEVGDESCVVWDAALVLAKYLQTEHFCSKEGLRDKRVVELGAGTGVVGLIAAVCGLVLKLYTLCLYSVKCTNQTGSSSHHPSGF